MRLPFYFRSLEGKSYKQMLLQVTSYRLQVTGYRLQVINNINYELVSI